MTTPQHKKIGTLEFCTALNGDDPLQAISFLKRFVQTIRTERVEALCEDSDGTSSSLPARNIDNVDSDDDINNDSDDDMSTQSQGPPTKKIKKSEEWKMDTMSYNVPFVGTSTYKGSSGTVRKGEWPSGFLEAYLEQSPQAMEILGNGGHVSELPLVPPHGPLHEALLNRKESSGKILSTRLYGLYIQAMGEIATCGVPLEVATKQMKNMKTFSAESKEYELDKNSEQNTAKLEKNVQVKISYQNIISKIMKEHLSVLYNVLNNECTNSGKQSYILIESALTTLANLASTSVGAAREILRGLDSNIKDGALQRLAPSRFKPNQIPKEADQKLSELKNYELKASAAYLNLASVLLESGDLMISSYVISPGVKETKTKPGIAFIALRRVSATHTLHQLVQIAKKSGRKAYYMSLCRFFRSIRSMLLSFNDEEKEESGSFQKLPLGTLLGFFQGDVIEDITRTACISVGEDENKNSLEHIKYECRLMTVTILSDRKRSPFLKQLYSNRFSENVVASCTNNLTRCIQVLLSCTGDMAESQSFVIRCFSNSPKLFTAFLRVVQVPDPVASFSCISSFALITFLIDKGPHTWNFNSDGGTALSAEKAVLHIIPRGLTKNILTKALQSSNALLLLECLKTIGAIMKRIECFMSDFQDCIGGKSLIEKCRNIICKKLPDLQVLLAVRSKFDSFRVNEASSQIANSIVTMSFCEILQRYASIFKNNISSLQFDWIKFLPESASLFCSAELGLQNRLLSTLSEIYDSYKSTSTQSNTMTTPRAFRAFCSIMIQTDHPSIYEHSRKLAIKTLQSIIEHRSSNSDDICNELMLWVDGISSDILPTFCQMLVAIQKITVQHAVIVSNAWQQYHPTKAMEEITFTPILTVALASIASEPLNFSESFITFICRVTATTLMYQFNPMSLSSVVRFIFNDVKIQDESSTTTTRINFLVEYATSIVLGKSNLISNANCLLTALFGDTNIQSKVVQYLISTFDGASQLKDIYDNVINGLNTPITASLLLRQCIHHSKMDFDNKIMKNKVDNIFLKLFPIVVQRDNDVSILKAISESGPSISTYAILFTMTSSIAAKRLNNEPHPLSAMSTTCIDVVCSQLLQFFTKVGTEMQEAENTPTQLAFASGILPLIPSTKLVSLMQPLVNCCARITSSGSTTNAHTMPLLHLLLKILRVHSNQVLQDLPFNSVFSLWRTFSEEKSKNSITTSVRTLLEKIMAEIVHNYESYGLNAAHLLSKVQCTRTEKVTDILFENVSSDGNLESTQNHNFLLSLLLFDASTFALPIIHRLQNESIDDSKWDLVISALIKQVNTQKSCQDVAPSISNVTDAAVRRLETMMTNGEGDSFSSIIEAMGSLLSSGRMSSNILEKILNRSNKFLQGIRKCRQDGVLTQIEMDFLSFISNTMLSEDFKDERLSGIVILLSHISNSLPKVLKSADENKDDCENFLSLAIGMLKLLDMKSITSIKSSIVKRMLVTCLKFGIQSNVVISSQCLIIVRLLLTIIFSGSHLDESYKQELFRPHQIHAMTISHSNFPTLAMSSKCAARRELISLLICCVALDGSNITPVKWDVLSALLAGFDASLREDDRLLRRLLFLYESTTSDMEPSYRQSNILWGRAQRNVKSHFHAQNMLGSDHGGQWEPLIEALEVRRIRQTIAEFPVWERAEPPRENCIETWDVADEHQDSEDKSDLEDDNESLSEDTDVSSVVSTTMQGKGPPNHRKLQERMDRNDTKNDDRYSPAFMMPLILGLLESFALRASIGEDQPPEDTYDYMNTDDNQWSSQSNENEAGGKEENDPLRDYRESYVKVAFRLSQKGAIALSLSCLSSKCPDLRKIAVSTLYFFLQALKMKESQSIAQWRERPQLEMILNSVQRGLAVARAKKARQQLQDDEKSNDSFSIFVPMLPAVSAIFLARSTLIVSKPADEMYSSMNRYYLRIQDYHGAYNDCFSLPAFMTLFCSANDDNNQARKERLWALQLLKDGIVDEYCYKVVARRHVPELLFSSFDAFCCRHDSSVSKGKLHGAFDTECLMILEVFQRCLDYGGMSSYHHLVKGIGLFPWIQSMIESHSLMSSIHTQFFQMLQSALQATEKFQSMSTETNEFMFFDAIKLARNVIDVYDQALSSVNDDNVSSSTSVLQSSTCEILYLIQNIYKKSKDDNSFKKIKFEVNRNGIPVALSLKLMERVKNNPIIFNKTVGALCYLPMAEEAKETSSSDEVHNCIIEFCKAITSCILVKKDLDQDDQDTQDTYLYIMKRVKLIANSLLKEDYVGNLDIAEMIISCRRRMTHIGLHGMWLETLSDLVASQSTEPKSVINDEVGSHDTAEKERAELIRLVLKCEEGAKGSSS